jgi:hypothetical protein
MSVARRTYWLIALATGVLAWAALFWAPIDPAQRFHAAAATDYLKAGWIYDRLHDDPTPVDIAFLGSSRMMQGVNAASVEAGLNAATGRGLHVANLALPDVGRDVPYLTERLLLATKRPKLLVIETDYLEGTRPAAGFPLLTSGANLLEMPWLLNQGLPYDLLYVPAHNLRLLWDRLAGAGAGEGAPYAGPHWDDTEITRMRDGHASLPRTEFLAEADLRRDAAWWAENLRRKAAQYDDWAWLQLRYNEKILRRMLEAARAAGTRVVFLYIPPVGIGAEPFHAALLRQFGEIWALPPEIEGDHRLWMNPTHPNAYGARKISAWLGQRLAAEFGHAEAFAASPSGAVAR